MPPNRNKPWNAPTAEFEPALSEMGASRRMELFRSFNVDQHRDCEYEDMANLLSLTRSIIDDHLVTSLSVFPRPVYYRDAAVRDVAELQISNYYASNGYPLYASSEYRSTSRKALGLLSEVRREANARKRTFYLFHEFHLNGVTFRQKYGAEVARPAQTTHVYLVEAGQIGQGDKVDPSIPRGSFGVSYSNYSDCVI